MERTWVTLEKDQCFEPSSEKGEYPLERSDRWQ